MTLRFAIWLVAAACAVVLSACGGSDQTAAEQRIPRGVAADLAAKSEAIAAALDAGDQCGAAELADELKDAVEAAVSGGRVPPAFQQDLEAAATDLQNDVNCPPPVEDEGEGNGNGKGKGKGKGHDGEETTTGETTSEGE